MDNEKLNKIISFVIYTLTLCLIFLIIYNAYLLYNSSYFSSNPPKNSMKVGPISIESSNPIYN